MAGSGELGWKGRLLAGMFLLQLHDPEISTLPPPQFQQTSKSSSHSSLQLPQIHTTSCSLRAFGLATSSASCGSSTTVYFGAMTVTVGR